MYTDSVAQEITRDPDRSRTAILDAAAQLFATDGYDRTSLAAIGEAAGVSRGLPSYFFSSKQDLYDAVMDRSALVVHDLLESMRHALSERGLQAALEHFVDIYVDFLEQNPNVVRLLQWQFLKGDPSRHVAVTSSFREMTKILESQLPAGKRIDARFLIFSIVGMSIFPFMTAPRDAAFTQAYKRHLIQLLRGRLGA
jgi:TetR/AcrR family transcriptional regulator